MDLIVENWGGYKTLSGGTKRTIQLNRPWQVEIQVNEATCPFCLRQRKIIERSEEAGGWQLFPNEGSQYKFHELILPDRCIHLPELRRLGGRDKVRAAFRFASRRILRVKRPLWLGVHIGYLAGQNQGHLHYHLVEPYPYLPPGGREAILQSPAMHAARLIEKSPNASVRVGGIRAGMCYILPDNPIRFTEEVTNEIVQLTLEVVDLFARKFRSKQGLPPDYLLGYEFNEEGAFLYGFFMPILSNFGLGDYFGLLEGKPITLPWPHEETVRYLKERG